MSTAGSFMSLIYVVYIFPSQFWHVDFTFIIIDVGELIFSAQTYEVTVYENEQLIFPMYV